MAHSHSWQVGAVCLLVAQLGQWARDLRFPYMALSIFFWGFLPKEKGRNANHFYRVFLEIQSIPPTHSAGLGSHNSSPGTIRGDIGPTFCSESGIHEAKINFFTQEVNIRLEPREQKIPPLFPPSIVIFIFMTSKIGPLIYASQFPKHVPFLSSFIQPP